MHRYWIMRLFNRVNYFSKGRVGRSETKRTLLQFVFAAMANPHFKGFLDGRIYNGSSKAVCVPGLNCYSCPGAAGACPIGSLQAIIGSPKYTISLYVMGLLVLFGTLLGRLVCGFLCVFGLVQDLLFKIPTPKFKLSKAVDSKLRYLKYVVLIVMVIALPMFLTNRIGIAPPYFCKYLCPAGTLEAAFPLLAKNPFLRETIGHIFFIKLSILIVVVLSSIFIYRPFCKYLCPLGAIYGLFNKLGIFRLEFEKSKCVDCGLCEKSCKMDIDVRNKLNSAECIRCGACIKACNHGALDSLIGLKTKGSFVNKSEKSS